MGKLDLKIDWLRGGKSSFPIPMGASVAIYPKSGKFVTAVATGAILTLAAGTTLAGWVECGSVNENTGLASDHFTSHATARVTKLNCIRDLTAIFRMPLVFQAATYTTNYGASLIGTSRDIYVSTYQYLDCTNGSVDPLIVVGGKAATAAVADALLGDGYVDVMMSPALAIGVA